MRSKNLLLATQTHSSAERRIDFHETDLLDQPDRLTESSFTTNRREKSASPTTIPVTNIDDIEIGAQMTVDVNTYGADNDFLYLTKSARWDFKGGGN